MADVFTVTVLKGGLLRTSTDQISDQNHSSAESFVRAIEEMAGGPTEHQHKAEGMLHHHHSHEHETETE